jgi:hypothetical protein
MPCWSLHPGKSCPIAGRLFKHTSLVHKAKRGQLKSDT